MKKKEGWWIARTTVIDEKGERRDVKSVGCF
jgi:hypothetical protein